MLQKDDAEIWKEATVKPSRLYLATKGKTLDAEKEGSVKEKMTFLGALF